MRTDEELAKAFNGPLDAAFEGEDDLIAACHDGRRALYELGRSDAQRETIALILAMLGDFEQMAKSATPGFMRDPTLRPPTKARSDDAAG